MSIGSTHVLSPTRMVVRLTAAPGAATGFRDVTVSTDRGDGSTETATGIGAVQVVGAAGGADDPVGHAVHGRGRRDRGRHDLRRR